MKLNVHFFVAFFIACWAILNDIIIYFFGFTYNFSIITTLATCIIIFFWLCKNKKILLKSNFEKADLLFWFLTITFMLIDIWNPDNDWDTKSYHIYLQENFFNDKINYDFFPGRIFCVYLFPLGDRMHYIFRNFLGFRIGTLFSYYSAIVLFYQIKMILKFHTNNSKYCSFFSNFIFLVNIIMAKVGTYYVDNQALIFILEVFLILLEKNNIIEDKKSIYFLFFTMGIAIGIKITSVFFLLIVILYYFIKNIKKIRKIRINIILLAVLLILPFIIYLIDNFKQTGSILFPYYNSIFRSEYFGLYNWKDPRFGVHGVINIILWPIIVSMINLNYGTSLKLENCVIDPMWAIGYIGCIVILISNFVKAKKLDKKMLELLGIALISTFVWIFMLEGYLRYGIFVVILYGIVLCSYVINILPNKRIKLIRYELKITYPFIFLFNKNIKKNKISKIIKRVNKKITIFAVIIGITIQIFMIFTMKNDNIKYAFKDIQNENKVIKIDGIWGTTEDMSEQASLIRENGTPIVGLEKSFFESSEKNLDIWYDKILNNNIYVIIDYTNGKFEDNTQVINLNKNNFEIEEFVTVLTSDDFEYINVYHKWVVVKVKYMGEREYV